VLCWAVFRIGSGSRKSRLGLKSKNIWVKEAFVSTLAPKVVI